jgi:hypothetical protein
MALISYEALKTIFFINLIVNFNFNGNDGISKHTRDS